MKKESLLIILPLFTLSLSSCSAYAVHHEMKEYILEMDYKKDMRILQLNDIHIGDKDNRALHYDFLDLTIKDANADLIVLDGDIFTFASRHTAKELFSFIDSYGIPWTATFGNHDEQCYFSVDWLTSYLNDFGSNCLFKDIQDDDVFGNANFAINLKRGSEVFETIVIMDSNRYYFGDYFGYDYIKPDQVEWYENLIHYIADQYGGGSVIPSLAYFHIPLMEFSDAWDAYQKGDPDAVYLLGEKREDVCSPKINTGLFDKMVELGSTNAIFCAHDHRNSYAITYKGITLSYGLNSTDRVYFDPDLMGGQVITLREDHSFAIEQIFHTYEEVAK